MKFDEQNPNPNPYQWTILSYQQILDTPYLKIRAEQVAIPNGPIVPDYYIIENRGWVGIVPVTEDGRFLINRQYRHPIGSEVLEFPAGGFDPDELDPLITARRELMEETGYSVEDDQIEQLSYMIADPSRAKARVWWYLARNVRKTGVQKIDPSEIIENLLVTPQELLHLIHTGAFSVQGQVAAAYMALERLGMITITS
jgi:8-oxo-dGTP pyrophosphatase MutT (NUDIX family)